MTKKNVLSTGLLAVGIYAVLAFANINLGLECSFWTETGSFKWCESAALVLIPLILLVPFSLLTYKLREEVFQAWLHFAYVWIPLSIIVTLPLSLGGGGGGFGMNLIHPEAIMMFFAGIFTLVSLIIIAWKYVVTRKG